MKRITPKKTIKKYYLITAAVVLVLALGAVIYVYAFNGSIFGWKKTPASDSSINYSPPTEEQKKAGENTKDASLNSSQEQKPNNTNETPAPPTPTQGSKSNVSLVITAANQNPTSLQIRSEIGIVTSEGTCTLTLTKDSKTITKTANIQALPRISTCQGFDIPLSELSSGQWSAALHFENSTLVADTTKQITVQ